MSEHTPEPLIYAAWVRALKRRLAQDELGPLVGAGAGPEPVFLERVYRNVDGAAAWCDVEQTTASETCTEMARRALDDALLELDGHLRRRGWRAGAGATRTRRCTCTRPSAAFRCCGSS